MSINGVNIGQPAFTGKTKKGNNYDKTNAGKAVGGVLGTCAMGTGLLKAVVIKKRINDTFKNAEFDEAVKTLTNLKPSQQPVNILAAGIIAGATILGIGAVVDKMINHHEAKQADKA